MWANFLSFFFSGGGAFTVRQDNFTHVEPSQSVDGATTGDPREKTTEHAQAELVGILK